MTESELRTRRRHPRADTGSRPLNALYVFIAPVRGPRAFERVLPQMPLLFRPHPGTLLMCDFDTGFKPPEMTKKRPVVVISPRRRRSMSKLCTVVPLSTAVPKRVERFHHRMDPRSVPAELGTQESWAKCDMLYTVFLERLDRVPVNREGRRVYISPRVLGDDLDAIRQGVMDALGLDPEPHPGA